MTEGSTVLRRVRTITLVTGAVFTCWWTSPAHADLLWTLSGTSFNQNPGGDITGTFITDDAGTIESWDIATTAYGSFPGEIFNSNDGSIQQGGTGNYFALRIIDDSGDFILQMDFDAPLVLSNSPITGGNWGESHRHSSL